MTKDEIVETRKKLSRLMAEANSEVERIALEIRILHTRCEHPDKFKSSCMGESCMVCPDCGWSS